MLCLLVVPLAQTEITGRHPGQRGSQTDTTSKPNFFPPPRRGLLKSIFPFVFAALSRPLIFSVSLYD